MSDSIIPTRQVQPNPDQAGQIQEFLLTAEVIPAVGNAPEWKIVPGALKNRMAIRTLREPKLKSSTSNRGHWKSRTKRRKLANEDDLADPRPGRPLKNLPSRGIGGTLGNAYMVSHVQLYLDRSCEVEIHNIKQRDGETIEDFIEWFKVETRRMKGAPECMRIFGFMHGVNNPELTKRLNEHVRKTMEEMMIITTAFIRGEAAAASKKKGHSS
ncbi:hypothetical protein Tco_0925748 [Tanacetum coccineum]|uniref:Reverse transcriptase domain-containing protein n=1 Tax=Tanacetum coccineum TaxID=301880 RepID=A0ABQ5D8T6_9ASTR